MRRKSMTSNARASMEVEGTETEEPVVAPAVHATACGGGTRNGFVSHPVIQAAGGGPPNGFCGSPTCFGITAILLGITGLMCSIIPAIRVHKCVADLYDDDNYYYDDDDEDDCTLIFPFIVGTVGLGLLVASCVVCCCWCGACGASGRNNAATTIVVSPSAH